MKKKRRKKKKDEERRDKGRGKLTIFIEVRKEDLEGGGVATCARAFGCLLH